MQISRPIYLSVSTASIVHALVTREVRDLGSPLSPPLCSSTMATCRLRAYQAGAVPSSLCCLCNLRLSLQFSTFVAGCGSSSAAAVTTSTATTTATSCFTQATGTIQNINGTTLLIASPRGAQIHATYTNNTVFLRETTLTPAGLQEGMNVAVRAVKNSDNTYSAVQVTVRNSSTSTFTPRSSAGSIRSCTPRQRTNGGNGQGNL